MNVLYYILYQNFYKSRNNPRHKKPQIMSTTLTGSLCFSEKLKNEMLVAAVNCNHTIHALQIYLKDFFFRQTSLFTRYRHPSTLTSLTCVLNLINSFLDTMSAFAMIGMILTLLSSFFIVRRSKDFRLKKLFAQFNQHFNKNLITPKANNTTL